MKNRNRFIVHVDMDAFFASVEQRDHPEYRDKPVVVGADPKNGKGRGVVSTCSYEARTFGIHSAMPITTAWRLCPHAFFVAVDMDKYLKVAQQIHEIFYSFTPDVESISIDEAFLDITGSYHLFGTPLDTCIKIKKAIKKETQLTASVGLAPTKMAAKIASDLKKPDGLVVVSPEGLHDFLRDLPIRKIWGLGEKAEEILYGMGIKSIGELARTSPECLEKRFGRSGVSFWCLANGIDDRPVSAEGEAKSISNETTFEEDTYDTDEIGSALMWLCQKVSDRLRQSRLKCKTLTLKIRFEGFDTHTRSITMGSVTNYTDVLYKEIKELYNEFRKNGRKVRLVGVKATNFSQSEFQDTLFPAYDDKKKEATHKAVDDIKNRFGDGSIYRAGSVLK